MLSNTSLLFLLFLATLLPQSSAQAPQPAQTQPAQSEVTTLRAGTQLVVVDVVAVADGYRASKLRGATVVNSKNEKIGELDDLIVGKDRVLFGIIQVGGFLGIGSHLIAVPYSSLQISEEGKRIVLPGASKEHVKDLPEFKYR